jgi:hypothetical protein
MQTARIGWLCRCCRAHIACAATGTSLLAHSLPCTCRHRPPVQLVSRCLLAREAPMREGRESCSLAERRGRAETKRNEASISNKRKLTTDFLRHSHSRCPFETLLLLHSRRHLSLDRTGGPLAFRLSCHAEFVGTSICP